MNCEYKKLKQTKRTIKLRKSNLLKRTQFCRHPIPRKKGIKRLHHTAPPVEIDAAREVLLGSATAGPAGTLMGIGSATFQTSSHIGISVLKKIRERAEEESAKIQGDSH